MPIGPARMPLMEHLGELRMRIVRIVVCLLIGVAIFYFASNTVAQFLIQPIAEFLPKGDDGQPLMNFFGGLDAFLLRFQLAFLMSLVACMPIILWQLLAFFLPALKPKERKWFIPTFVSGVALFMFGTVFCYLIILNPAFQWMTEQAAGFGEIFPEAKQYIDLIVKFEIGFGLAFELPLVVFYLVVFNIVPYKKLRASWRVVYIALMIVSAVITPDASPVTMLLMFAAMVGLYELSLFVSRTVLAKRIKQQAAELEKEQAEEEAWQKERASEKLAAKRK